MSQADTEAVLREAVEQNGVVIGRGVELIALSQDAFSRDPSPVRMILRHSDDHLKEVKAPWIISAEGGA
ncbi:hypothetical protein AA0229_0274 [Gluconobacter cerinus NRIC 0229]|uniref:FAD-binding domain-containing protein n=1 Tax=Gluconobacter cerinus TaxID=38307 RepID=A0AAV5NHR7_9PROT|nr:hypothetical protein AA0229_0274 [Gluconobacter cerinus NRIC 0229]GLQ63910.1 hypothetical protein GCM10007867_27560 [Gluconobacter cerinus]